MPSTSKKQVQFMAAVAHNPAFAKKVGVPQSVGQDFNKADKGRKFRKGGSTNPEGSRIANPRPHHGLLQLPNVSLKKYAGFNKGGDMKQVDMNKNPGLAKLPTDVRNKMGYMKKGGMASDVKEDMPMMKKVAKEEVMGHEKRMHKMAAGGKAGQLSKADGCATKGKSKGTIISMKSGGMC